jgi:putative RecB family exonuclease
MIALAESPPAPATGLRLPEHISPTSAKDYLGCSLRFFFGRVQAIPRQTSPALHLGKAVHAALQHYHLAVWRGGDASPEAIAQAFGEVFTAMEKDEGPVSWKTPKAREKAYEDGLRVVSAYLDSPNALKESPKAVEVFLRENIDGLSVPLTGAIDLVQQDLTPVDFKTSACKPDPKTAAFDHEIQLVCYQIMIEKATGETPPALDLLFLVKTKTPQVIPVSIPPADEHRKRRVVNILETAVQGIAQGRFHPQPGMHCSWCSFRNECSKWKGDAS